MKFLLTFAMLICLVAKAEVRRPAVPPVAGNESGAGGHGLVSGNRLYFYDFAEYGVAEKPYVDASLFTHVAFIDLHNRLKLALNGTLDPESLRILTAKVLDVYQSSEDLAYNIVSGITMMQWRSVTEEVFHALLHNPALEVDAGRLKTVGFRQGLDVRFNKKHLTDFSPAHRAGIVIHEVLSAYVLPTKLAHYALVRNLTGLLFSENIKDYREVAKAAEFLGVQGMAVPLDALGTRQYTGYIMQITSPVETLECQTTFARQRYLQRNHTAKAFADAACPDPNDVSLFEKCAPLPTFYRGEATIRVSQQMMPDRRMVDYLRVDAPLGVYHMLQILGHQSPRLQVHGHCRAFAEKVYDRFIRDFQKKGILEVAL